MSKRQPVVNFPPEGIDAALAAFIADVVELAGLFRGAAEQIARQEGQTQARWYALSVFSEERVTVSQAARRLGTTRQAVQRTANELIDRGLATIEANPDHRTSPFIVLTDDGLSTLSRISRTAMSQRRDWFSESQAADLADAHVEVRRLRDALREVTR
jgi:DNA-binding MarR family transcriptional regulator